MRPCKQSDIQALEAVVSAIDQFAVDLSAIRHKVIKLKKDLDNYIKEQQEPINVQTTHGLSANNG
jgi:hypothetical protein